METQPASVNWSLVNNKLNKGEARALAWQAIGHGCDAVLYWQWRSALNGQEQFHGSLIDQSGAPRPFFEEAAELGDDLRNAGVVLAGTHVEHPPVAIINDYESRWSLEHHRHHTDFDYVQELNRWYKVLYDNHIPVDIISPDAALDGYRLVIAPHLAVIDPEREKRFSTYIEKGGALIVTCRSGVKDHCDAMLPTRPPGTALSYLTGIEVEDYYPLDRTVGVSGNLIHGNAHTWAERLKSKALITMQPMAKYDDFNGWIDGMPAVTANVLGRGVVYYVSCLLDDTSMSKMMQHILTYRFIRPVMNELPPGVEVCVRMNERGEKFYCIINLNIESRKVKFPTGLYEYITQAWYSGEVNMPPYSVALLGPREKEVEDIQE